MEGMIFIREQKDPSAEESTQKHAEWAKKVLADHPELNRANVEVILQEEVGKVFCKCLEHAGVYKCTEEGRGAMLRFVDAVNAQ